MRAHFALCIGLVAAAGCKKSGSGLPPASDWNGSAAAAGATTPIPPQNGPHGGVAMGGGGAVDPNNPHAGLDMSGAQGGPEGQGGQVGDMPADNPHAGLGMDPNGAPMGGQAGGQDMSKLGLPPPDPNRPIDPNHRIAGVIHIDPKLKDMVKPGGAVFLIVKHADASGAPTGTPLAVEKLTWQGDQIPFELTDHDAMIAGTELAGDVVVVAHYDTDGDAISKTTGDVLGQARVTIPATAVQLTLDKPIP